ncbi:hypothetical protein NBRC116592_16460 [Colwellia sp. KU-HH00111]|uniref:hypothetical protein n=1 Tax=Colwellia sp. KU-HH00111 TaxID=3127652 RepID=UPI003106AEE2
MKSSYEFLSQVLDSITAHIVVINELGEIQFVNKAWSTFGNNNACVIGDNWKGVNYINECDKASAMGDDFGTQAGAGIRRVIENKAEIFILSILVIVLMRNVGLSCVLPRFRLKVAVIL